MARAVVPRSLRGTNQAGTGASDLTAAARTETGSSGPSTTADSADEPPEKHTGLAAGETGRWLREFGLDDIDPE